MGCGCNKRAAATAFVFVSPEGDQTERRTEIEARAAQIRMAKAAGVEDTANYGEVKPVSA